MTKAVLTTAPISIYSDLPEYRYHFPKRYLKQVEAAQNDWIVYYQPRRTNVPEIGTGLQCYFATAEITYIEEDTEKRGHFFAYIRNYLDFDNPVPFKEGQHYYESSLQKSNGKTNRGAFRRSVRTISDDEYSAILNAGYSGELDTVNFDGAHGDQMISDHDKTRRLVTRPFRDAAFRRNVLSAYDDRCAISGLQLRNGGGRAEVQAAHIRPVAEKGPDSTRNGLALTSTVHWMFDRGLISIGPDFEILVSSQFRQEQATYLINTDRTLSIPKRPDYRPHPSFLEWHRNNRFKP